MNTREKKFFAPTLKSYNNDLNAKWRVEWYVPTYNGFSFKRVVRYGNINQGRTVEERLALSSVLIGKLGLEKPVEVKKSLLDEVIELNRIYWRQKTIEAYNTVAQSFKVYLAGKNPEKATDKTIQEYLVYLQKNNLGKNTISKYRNTLFTLFSKAQSLKLVSKNPVTRVPHVRRRAQSLQFFSDAQIKKFKYLEINEQLWLGIQFLFYCFIRPGELRLLKISAINYEYNFVEIPGEISKNGKTEKVAIPATFKKHIEKLQHFPNNFYILSKAGFPGQIPISTKWLNNEHSKVLKKLKIIGRYAFYSWKHTGVVKAVRAGINIKDLQLQLRHHSLDMVNEYLKNLGVMDSEDLINRYPTL